jgi:integrase/recombinase XerD
VPERRGLYTADKRGRVTAKGGAVEWIHWQSGAAQLLPRLIAGRAEGPLFLTERRAPEGAPTMDVCPITGRVRLSYQRAEEIFEESTRLLANPLARPEQRDDLQGFTLHRWRHSSLTHDAENGTSTPILMARSRQPRCGRWSCTPAPGWTRWPGTSPPRTRRPAAGSDLPPAAGRLSCWKAVSTRGVRGRTGRWAGVSVVQSLLRDGTGVASRAPWS